MSGSSYPATPLLRRLSADNGWRHEVICDAHGRLEVVTYVRIGLVWTDSVAIAGEDQTLAMRHRTNDDRLILPAELPSESRAVWRRHGRCEDVRISAKPWLTRVSNVSRRPVISSSLRPCSVSVSV